MTIDSSYTSETFNRVSSGKYTFSFEHLGPETIRVAEVSEDGAVTDLDQSDYSVVATGPGPIYTGGTVTVSNTPATVERIAVSRETPQTQLVDYQPYSPFPAETHEYALDKLTMLTQESNYNASLAVGLVNNLVNQIEDIEGEIETLPRANMFIPLAGTNKNAPIVGTLEWKAGSRNLGSYFMRTTSAYIGNWWGMFTETKQSGIVLQTRGSGGTAHNFQFNPGGAFTIPHVYGGAKWFFAVGPNQGEDDSLTLWPTDTADIHRKGNFVVSTTVDNHFVMDSDGMLRLPKTATAGDDVMVATTKEYVDSLLGPGSGESNTQTNLGDGAQLGMAKAGVDLPLRTLVAPASELVFTEGADTLQIAFDPTGVTLPDAITASLTAGDIECTGQITMDGPVDADNVVATKEYVDGVLSGGGLMVDLVSNQTINGSKTFLAPTTFDSVTAGNLTAASVGVTGTLTSSLANTTVTGNNAMNGLNVDNAYLLVQEARGATLGIDYKEVMTEWTSFAITTAGTSFTYNGSEIAHAGRLGSGLVYSGGVFNVSNTVMRTNTAQTISGKKTFTTQQEIEWSGSISNNPDNIASNAALVIERGTGERLGLDTNELSTTSPFLAFSSKGELFQFNQQEICHEGRLDSTLQFVDGLFGVASGAVTSKVLATHNMQNFISRLVCILTENSQTRQQVHDLLEEYQS